MLPLTETLLVTTIAFLLQATKTAAPGDPPPTPPSEVRPTDETSPAAPQTFPAAPQEEERRGDDLLELDRVVVTATRGPRETFDIPRSITVADEENLRRKNQLVALDALDERIGVWVEKRNGASSDPVLRGLSGGNVLALVDGNSLTTLWGEGGYAGDDMYGKVDAESIERIEVIRGPSSVLYGTNALGGVINFITRRPPLEFTESGFEYGGRFKTAFGSASNYWLGRGDVWGAHPRFRYRLGFSAREIDDVRGGGDLGLLSPSGGEDYNWDLNSEFRLGEGQFLEFSGQMVNRNNVPKYYRPTQRNFNDRNAVALSWWKEEEGSDDVLKLSIYGQDKEDIRVWLDQDKTGVAQWQTFAADLQSSSTLAEGEHVLTWGLHFNVDEGESPDDEQFTITTPVTGAQKASPDSTWTNVGAYLQDEWFIGDDWSVVASARVDWFRYRADDNTFWTIPGSTAAENVGLSEPGTYRDTALTGGLGLVRYLDPDWTVYGSWSRGYRLFPPSFGLRQTGYGILAPTDGLLDPITGDQFEIGTRTMRGWWSASVASYYTIFDNFQQPTPGEWDGMTEFDLDGNGTIEGDEGIYVIDEAEGYVTGLEVETAIDLGHFHPRLDQWSWINGFMLNYGRVEYEGDEEPLRHTHPPRWLMSLRWEDENPQTRGWFEVVADLVDRFDEVSDGRLNGDVGYLNDPQDPMSGLLRPYGLPGYSVFDVRGGWDIARGVSLTVGVENLFDKKYRSAHSRMDAPGRTLLVGLEVRR
jgi:hemoglobin/transferrin/lactoferrin receptor protein